MKTAGTTHGPWRGRLVLACAIPLASLLWACAHSGSRPIEQVPPGSVLSHPTKLDSVTIPSSVFYAPGPSSITRRLEIDSIVSDEVRTCSAPDVTGKWTITVDLVKDAIVTPRQRLIVSIDSDGSIILHELFNAQRESVATFTPPLRLLPASIVIDLANMANFDQSDQYRLLGESKARIVEGKDSKASTRSGTARALVKTKLASASIDSDGLRVLASTQLDISVGPARIRRQSVYDLLPTNPNASGWSIQSESRDFSVRVGPITIEREKSSVTASDHSR